MDPFSQGLLGSSLASSFSEKKSLRISAFCGAVAGTVPDLDILIRSKEDTLLFIEFHRHFSHSLFFVPLGSIIVSLILYSLLRNITSFKNIFIYTTLGMLTHGFLDSCTSYGTLLLWPLSELRVAWNIISIIDPIFTFTLVFFLFLSILKKSLMLVRLGLAVSLIYLGFGAVKYMQVKDYVTELASQRGHKIERILLNPTIGNNILWRSIYQFNKNYYVDAIYMPLTKKSSHLEGVVLEVIDKEKVFSKLSPKSLQREDIRRFSYFSQDFIYLHPDYPNAIADLRYGTLPHDYKSLWGIQVDIDNQDNHVSFKSLRNFTKNNYEDFWNMLGYKFWLQDDKVLNVKTFSGPMGMGLAKSFYLNSKKICVYNTINGQEKIILDSIILSCPKNLNDK